MSYGFTTPAQAYEVVRSNILKCDRQRVQGNEALNHRVYAIMSQPFWAVIENSLIDGFNDVPRPDIVEAVAVLFTQVSFDDTQEEEQDG